MKKLSEFLSTLDAWSIYDQEGLAKDFTAETGEQPCWPTFTEQQTRRLMEARGLGGTLTPNEGKLCAYGYVIAVSVAEKYVPKYLNTKRGRGFAFDAAVNALQQAGK